MFPDQLYNHATGADGVGISEKSPDTSVCSAADTQSHLALVWGPAIAVRGATSKVYHLSPSVCWCSCSDWPKFGTSGSFVVCGLALEESCQYFSRFADVHPLREIQHRPRIQSTRTAWTEHVSSTLPLYCQQSEPETTRATRELCAAPPGKHPCAGSRCPCCSPAAHSEAGAPRPARYWHTRAPPPCGGTFRMLGEELLSGRGGARPAPCEADPFPVYAQDAYDDGCRRQALGNLTAGVTVGGLRLVHSSRVFLEAGAREHTGNDVQHWRCVTHGSGVGVTLKVMVGQRTRQIALCSPPRGEGPSRHDGCAR